MVNGARRAWIDAEPIHALTYFAPEAHDAFERAGLRGFWRGYFAGRAAPMGAVGAGVVSASFFGFEPSFVGRAIPAVWSVVTPTRALDARLEGVHAAAARVLPELPVRDAMHVAQVVRDAAESCDRVGRILFAANAELDWPAEPPLALWHATTLLREHRGDGHVLALAAAGIGPTEAHVLRIADDRLPVASIQPYRGWREDDWARAETRLRERGWLNEHGSATASGHQARAAVEAETDRLSADLVSRIPEAELDDVLGVLARSASAVRDAAVVPFPNPMGVPREVAHT